MKPETSILKLQVRPCGNGRSHEIGQISIPLWAIKKANLKKGDKLKLNVTANNKLIFKVIS
jgi:hypothetical protein